MPGFVGLGKPPGLLTMPGNEGRGLMLGLVNEGRGVIVGLTLGILLPNCGLVMRGVLTRLLLGVKRLELGLLETEGLIRVDGLKLDELRLKLLEELPLRKDELENEGREERLIEPLELLEPPKPPFERASAKPARLTATRATNATVELLSEVFIFLSPLDWGFVSNHRYDPKREKKGCVT